MVDVQAAISSIDYARESAEDSDYASAIAYYDSALGVIAKHLRGVTDPTELGKLREVQKRTATELELVKDLHAEFDCISGNAGPGPSAGRGAFEVGRVLPHACDATRQLRHDSPAPRLAL
jgi:hypothetical protein